MQNAKIYIPKSQYLPVLKEEFRGCLQGKGVLLMDSHGSPCTLANLPQGSNMVHVAMGDQDITSPGIFRFLQDTLCLGRRINDRTFPRPGANKDVAIVLEGTDFQSFEFHLFLHPAWFWNLLFPTFKPKAH
jgi:hypothetical protein